MIQSPEIESGRLRALAYMKGFRHGVSGQVAASPDADYQRGHCDGRSAVREAHRVFCLSIGHNPATDVLR